MPVKEYARIEAGKTCSLDAIFLEIKRKSVFDEVFLVFEKKKKWTRMTQRYVLMIKN